MGVLLNHPFLSILVGFSLINHPFWGYDYGDPDFYIPTAQNVPFVGSADGRVVAGAVVVGPRPAACSALTCGRCRRLKSWE